MKDQAIAKLQAEIAGNANNTYVRYVGQFLVSHIDSNPQDANKILTEGKTIAKSLDEMKKVAQTKQVGNMAMLTPDEGLAVVLKYYGIEGKPSIPSPAAVVPASSGSDFDVSLDDYL